MPWAVSTCANRSSQLRNLRFRKFHFVMYMDDWDRLFSLQFFSRISRRIHSRVASDRVISFSTARLTSFNFGIFCLVDYMIIRICRCVHWPSRPCSTIEDSFRESLNSFCFWHGCSESFNLGCIWRSYDFQRARWGGGGEEEREENKRVTCLARVTSRVANCDVKQYVRYRTGHNRDLGASVRKSFVKHETGENLKSSFHSSWRQCPSTGRCCFGYCEKVPTRESWNEWMARRLLRRKAKRQVVNFKKDAKRHLAWARFGPSWPVLTAIF